MENDETGQAGVDVGSGKGPIAAEKVNGIFIVIEGD